MNSTFISLRDTVSNFLLDDSTKNSLEEEESTNVEKTLDLKLIKVFCRTALIWSGVYIFSSYGYSISWLLIPLFAILIHRKEELRRKRKKDIVLSSAKQAACSNEKSMIESRFKVDELPSWVIFPDKVISIS